MKTSDVADRRPYRSRVRWIARLASSSIISLATAGMAHSQTSEGSNSQPLEQVVVTGSHIGRTGFTSPTPMTVVGSQDIERKASSNVADLLNSLPQFRPTVTPSILTVSQTVGANYLDLRGLGISRTLTLVNGQRYIPSNITGQVDLNLIPTIMLDRTDVVTGGASAAYGSDAVAGVVNLIYKRNVEGFEGIVQGGRTRYGDNREYNLGLLYGTSFAGDRAHLLIGAQYVDNGGGDELDSRAWGTKDWNIIPNPNATATNGQPARLLESGVRNSNQTFGGLIVAPASLRGTQFLTGGVPAPFTYGSLAGSTYMVGGSGFNSQRYILLEAPQKRFAATARIGYEVTPNIAVSAELSYGHEAVTSRSGQLQDLGLVVRQDNAFLPASIRNQMIAAGATTLTLGRRSGDIMPDNSINWFPIVGYTNLSREVVSLDARVWNSWKLNAYYQHGESVNDQELGERIHANWLRAIDAVVDPATSAIVCRSTLSTDPAVRAAAAGCVPFNVFGNHSRSPAAAAYVSAMSHNKLHFLQDAVSASMQGEPLSIWGGPVSVALGAEYRRDKAFSVVDPISAAGGFDLIDVQPVSGVNAVAEGFVETVVPILSNLPWAQQLEFNGAARYTSYSLSGGVTSWKVGLNYQPVDSIRFRGTRSRDIRAPNLNELFSPSVATLQPILDPVTNISATAAVRTGGNPNLHPEFADTTTVGVILTPSFLPGFRASVDWYDINIKGAITTLSALDIVGRCASGNTLLCNLVTRDPTTRVVTAVNQIYENLAGLENQGVDFELAYRRSLADWWSRASGDLTVRVLATYVTKVIQNDGRVSISLLGDTGGRRPGGLPIWTGSTVISYDRKPFALSTEIRYVDSGKLDALGTPQNINTNFVPSRTYVQLSGAYELHSWEDSRLEMYGTINNLFDVDPPVVVTANAFPANASFYDVMGRTFTAGIRIDF